LELVRGLLEKHDKVYTTYAHQYRDVSEHFCKFFHSLLMKCPEILAEVEAENPGFFTALLQENERIRNQPITVLNHEVVLKFYILIFKTYTDFVDLSFVEQIEISIGKPYESKSLK
jgi:hypothetical protein